MPEVKEFIMAALPFLLLGAAVAVLLARLSKRPERPANETDLFAMWPAIGTALGIVLGTAIDNVGLGAGFGALLGAVIAVIRDKDGDN